MADERPDLLVPDSRIVSIDEARKDDGRKPGAKLHDYVTRGWALEAFSKVGIELGQKMYDQVSGEIAEHLEGMEARLQAMVAREIEARSFRGRFRTLMIRLGARERPRPTRMPVVDAVDVLDPNVAAAAADLDVPVEHVHAP